MLPSSLTRLLLISLNTQRQNWAVSFIDYIIRNKLIMQFIHWKFIVHLIFAVPVFQGSSFAADLSYEAFENFDRTVAQLDISSTE